VLHRALIIVGESLPVQLHARSSHYDTLTTRRVTSRAAINTTLSLTTTAAPTLLPHPSHIASNPAKLIMLLRRLATKPLKSLNLPQAPQTAITLSKHLNIRIVDVLKSVIRLGESPRTADTQFALEIAELVALDHNYEIIINDTPESSFKPASTRGKGHDARRLVVCAVGHVDHGKTTLLRTMCGIGEELQEAGGITQRIGSYEGHGMTFLDFPGHALFSGMRSRGVRGADVCVVLWVTCVVTGVLRELIFSSCCFLPPLSPPLPMCGG